MVEISVKGVMCIVSILMLFAFFTAMGLFCINPSTSNNITKYEFSFNYNNWKKINMDETMLGVITTAAAIVAISFSINHITFAKVYESGTSRSFKFFFNQQKLFTSLIALILLIIFSTIGLLIIHGIPEPLQFLYLTILVVGFIYSLGLFYISFHRTFRLLNKFDIMDDVENMIIREMEDLGNEA